MWLLLNIGSNKRCFNFDKIESFIPQIDNNGCKTILQTEEGNYTVDHDFYDLCAKLGIDTNIENVSRPLDTKKEEDINPKNLLYAQADAAAKRGKQAYIDFCKGCSKEEQNILKEGGESSMHEICKQIAGIS